MSETKPVEDDIDAGTPDEEGADSLPPLEEKYRTQMRQIVPQKIELPISALLSMLTEQIDVNPDFQRRERWNIDRQSRFIESLIMNVPVPPVFLGEDEYGKYVVLDGRQRLTAVSSFLKNEFELKKLEVWNELNGLKYGDLIKRDFAKFLTGNAGQPPSNVDLRNYASNVKTISTAITRLLIGRALELKAL